MEIYQTAAYQLISTFYGDKKAQRSQVPLINHIQEGLFILKDIQADLKAQEAYCLHPIFQADQALSQNYQADFTQISPTVLILVMEYRSIANQYLSQRQIQAIADIKLSPLTEVNQMLIADKVQNRKDFELYHLHTHPRSQELVQYFKNWLQALNIEEQKYWDWVNELKSIE
jgi:hypothetical protein